eukprot:TRINITY_DN569_c0_g1_i1.p1 TRINITY_DN569_c0_g1~~TRINITY_DN569_c0_g1_i1.p1  ORF type:complete len:503 (-),score=83.60 TRINITY_DN569_c0_g1_i1:78-1586(-)
MHNMQNPVGGYINNPSEGSQFGDFHWESENYSPRINSNPRNSNGNPPSNTGFSHRNIPTNVYNQNLTRTVLPINTNNRQKNYVQYNSEALNFDQRNSSIRDHIPTVNNPSRRIPYDRSARSSYYADNPIPLYHMEDWAVYPRHQNESDRVSEDNFIDVIPQLINTYNTKGRRSRTIENNRRPNLNYINHRNRSRTIGDKDDQLNAFDPRGSFNGNNQMNQYYNQEPTRDSYDNQEPTRDSYDNFAYQQNRRYNSSRQGRYPQGSLPDPFSFVSVGPVGGSDNNPNRPIHRESSARDRSVSFNNPYYEYRSKSEQLHINNTEKPIHTGRPSQSVPTKHNNRKRRQREEFCINLDSIIEGLDTRTTLMIKNIPNKYKRDQLLLRINEEFEGTYDFFYLPIDFRNRSNMGYAFINFISHETIPDFYNYFNNLLWGKFKSEKICEIAYGRIQGKMKLIDHFSSSSLMQEDSSCQPLIFYSSGPNKGQVQPFPIKKKKGKRKGNHYH